jgi:HPt (histidine-containing phosphotransfer) domain-containing protein
MEPTTGVIDMSRLIAVCSIGGAVDQNLLLELLRMFILDNDERVAALSGAMTSGDHEALRRLVHTISGSAATAGATRLAAMARAVETGLRAGGKPSADAIEAIVAEFGEVRARLRQLYPALEDKA